MPTRRHNPEPPATDPATSTATNTGWFAVQGRYATRDLWVAPEWEGKPKLGPYLLPDGREIPALIVDGLYDELGFPFWFRQVEGSRGQRRGDLLWAGGGESKVVSRRFVDALHDLGVTDDLRLTPVEIRDRRKRPIEADYVALVEPIGQGEIRAGLTTMRNSVLIVSARVLDGLRERGVTDFLIEPTTIDIEPGNPADLELPLATVVLARAYSAEGVPDEELADVVPDETFSPGDLALRDVVTFNGAAMSEGLRSAVTRFDLDDDYFPLDRMLESFTMLGMTAAAQTITTTRAALDEVPAPVAPGLSGELAYDDFNETGLTAAIEAAVDAHPELFAPAPTD